MGTVAGADLRAAAAGCRAEMVLSPKAGRGRNRERAERDGDVVVVKDRVRWRGGWKMETKDCRWRRAKATNRDEGGLGNRRAELGGHTGTVAHSGTHN